MVIDEVVSLCRQTFPKTITISTDVEAPLPLIKGTSGELYQVLLNMALNARDAMPSGGSLRIEARRRAVGEEVHPKLFQISSNECVELLVVDTGTGIPFHLREKIFDPFFTTKEIGKGTGLGLSMAYTIVRNHGGSIVVESEENVGTTFHIYLPVQESSPSTTNAPSENTPRAGGSGELILLVDDEETMRTLGEELLTEAGFRVLLAEDGLQAIEMYRQHQNEIALVILDLLMPKMDGGMTYLELKKINPQVRAFFCTGHATEKVIAPLLEEENLRVLPKPFRPGALVNMVREVLEL
jgi:two-component system cell cycle sensor histidine kinase/response regulator CckA